MLDGCEEVDDRIPVVDILVPQREKERMRDIMREKCKNPGNGVMRTVNIEFSHE